MNKDLFMALLHNAALLLALAIIYGISYEIPGRFKKYAPYMSGILIGLIGLAIMANPLHLAVGVVIDARSILIGTTGLVFGPIPTIIGVLFTGIFRIAGGGVGTITGLVVILSSAGIGLFWRRYLTKAQFKIKLSNLYAFGIIIHIAMLLAMLLLPLPTAIHALKSITLPVMVIYPIATVLLCILLIKQSETKFMEVALLEEKMLLETTLTSVGDGVISTDNKGNIVFLNKVGEELTGWTQEDARGRPIEEVFRIINEYTRAKNENIIEKVLKSGKIEELANHTILISKDGEERPIEDSAAPIVQGDGEIRGVVLVFRDFSEKKQKMEEIEYLSYHDQLTGLYNRRFYEEELIRLDTEKNLPLTIVMGDVNGLKLVNDSFGHAMGDELLKKVAEVIRKGSRAGEIIARLGGDEFVLILPNTDGAGAELIIKRIKELSALEKVGGVDLSVSFGYQTKLTREESIPDIFKCAEDHMYRHKLYESLSMRNKTIDLIMNTLYEKNTREMLHSKRVSEISEAIASKMNFDKDDINLMRIAGLMHDIGKIGIDEKILNKPHKLDADEWSEMERHSEIGYRILSSVNEFSEIAGGVLEHQERWDGSGYPRGLKGEEISVLARTIAIADSYDAMTSERAYGRSLSEEETIHEMKKCSGFQFDPDITRIFVEQVLGKEWV